jgi:hypothetical protein
VKGKPSEEAVDHAVEVTGRKKSRSHT